MKKSYTISIPVAYFWKVVVPLFIIMCGVGVIGGFFLVDRVVMPRIVGIDRDLVEVPSVAGLHWEKGRDLFFKSGLLTEIQSREYDSDAPVEQIISQQPEAGTKVKKGRRIAVVLSRGKEVGVIPDVRNQSERQARIELRKHGFSVGKIRKVYNSEIAVDVVIDAFPQSGTTISREMAVDLSVSRGGRPTHAEAPNIIGESLVEAKNRIEESGLTLGNINHQNNASLLPGTIISQSVAPGARVPLESSVDIVVSVIR